MEYPITNRYMDLNADRLGKDSHCAQYVRAALQEIEEKFNLLSRDDLGSIGGPFLHDLSRSAPAEPIDFNATHALPSWHLAPSYASPVTVAFDGAEGGAVWISDDEGDQSIAVRGPAAMRELARMLNAFADGYTGPLKAERYNVLDASSCMGEMYFVEDSEQGHGYYSGKSLERAQAVAKALNKARPHWHAAVRPSSVWICAAEGDIFASAALSRAELAHMRLPNQLIEREILGVQHKLNLAIAYEAARS